MELDRNYVKAWAKKGDIEFFMKEYHKSMDSYKAGLQIEPDNALCKQGLQKTIAKVSFELMPHTDGISFIKIIDGRFKKRILGRWTRSERHMRWRIPRSSRSCPTPPYDRSSLTSRRIPSTPSKP